MACRIRHVRALSAPLCAVLLAGCASTVVSLTPSPQAPVCERSATALVLWAPEWRPEQKDVAQREAAAAKGLQDFFGSSGCFAQAALRRMQSLGATAVSAQRAAEAGRFDRVVVIAVRELGRWSSCCRPLLWSKAAQRCSCTSASCRCRAARHLAHSRFTGETAARAYSGVLQACLPTCRPHWSPRCSRARLCGDARRRRNGRGPEPFAKLRGRPCEAAFDRGQPGRTRSGLA